MIWVWQPCFNYLYREKLIYYYLFTYTYIKKHKSDLKYNELYK